jgi:hypothetical protein
VCMTLGSCACTTIAGQKSDEVARHSWAAIAFRWIRNTIQLLSEHSTLSNEAHAGAGS